MKKHQKHTKLSRREFGYYGPNEIAILGSSCDLITDLVSRLSKKLSSTNKICYLDASHTESFEKPHFDFFTYHHLGSLELNASANLNTYQSKNNLAAYDLTFVNGNHFKGKKQILVLDKNKEQSIQKRIEQIDDILAIVLKDDIELFDVLKVKFPDFKSIPVFKLDQTEAISVLVNRFISNNIAPLNGLVLAGGKSTRMGKDKASLEYYGKPHSLYLSEMLTNLVGNCFLSKRENLENLQNVITDNFLDLGPFGALCSAFRYNPNNAYFVLATDLPYINDLFIENLIAERDPSKLATCVKGADTEFPEPLICIWEPKAYPVLLAYLSQGISCPRKILINEDVKTVIVDEKFITNINENESFLKVLKDIK